MITKPKIISEFYKAIFANRDALIGGKKFPLRKIKGLKQYKVGNLLFIEQNPKKATKWAAMARKGAKIMWVIDQKTNKYLYQIINGRLLRLTKPE